MHKTIVLCIHYYLHSFLQERKVSAGSESCDANDEEKQISEKKVDFLHIYSLYFESEGRKTC